ncbi:hypothetical protein B0F90DRAFT_1770074 [Multifurca ochricompacta]|uniref:Uncharacterized protein n=1 Tax=Multifurca ochricompacta TaxID=376703 RepID=A0AAD4LWV1_9AGAM|nr:hypothetical protein B0F90DRAFT_1770074 [Multifurca ochricompacta]
MLFCETLAMDTTLVCLLSNVFCFVFFHFGRLPRTPVAVQCISIDIIIDLFFNVKIGVRKK